jgi:hypothetical protein
MDNTEITKLIEYVENLTFVVEHEAEPKISKSIVAHFLKAILINLNQINDKIEV